MRFEKRKAQSKLLKLSWKLELKILFTDKLDVSEMIPMFLFPFPSHFFSSKHSSPYFFLSSLNSIIYVVNFRLRMTETFLGKFQLLRAHDSLMSLFCTIFLWNCCIKFLTVRVCGFFWQKLCDKQKNQHWQHWFHEFFLISTFHYYFLLPSPPDRVLPLSWDFCCNANKCFLLY